MIDNRVVGRRIASLRQAKGLTQQQLAATMSVTHQAVSKWESGAALPDIQTLMELAQFFGMTAEQLLSQEDKQEDERADAPQTQSGVTTEQAHRPTDNSKEAAAMDFQRLIQMAPYMSKEAVEEIALGIDAKLSAAQLARIAPYLKPEGVQALLTKHHPELSWDSMRKLAPFLSRDAVDALARNIAGGKETIKSSEDPIGKTLGDIGKALDGIGKGIGQAAQKALRFGGNVLGEVSSAICDLSSDASAAPAAPVRSERASALRLKAFERALKDGRWEWIAEHLGELEPDSEMKRRIAERAKEMGMHDWICKHMGGYADEFTIEAAIASGNWSWLGDNAWQFEDSMQQRVALAAMRAENWLWLGKYSDRLNLDACGMELARTTLAKGAKVLAAQLANAHLSAEQLDRFAQEVYTNGDFEMLDLIVKDAAKDSLGELLIRLAEDREWEHLRNYISVASTASIEHLMELAVDQGNFDAVDLLDQHL